MVIRSLGIFESFQTPAPNISYKMSQRATECNTWHSDNIDHRATEMPQFGEW